MPRRNVTRRGLDRIVHHEGLRLQMYRDSAGLPTIGVGHLLTRSELSSGKIFIGDEKVRWRDGLTKEQAFQLLDQDLDIAENAVEQAAPGLTDNQFDALVSFVFNVGVGAFQRSTLLRRIRSGQLDDVPAQMARWTRAGGRVVRGLQVRREAEGALWSA